MPGVLKIELTKDEVSVIVDGLGFLTSYATGGETVEECAEWERKCVEIDALAARLKELLK